ncbi:hypothetical protein CASFOL_018470 [Castilleja foliolosa]|uniref:RNase H type-1 domain-containing protein n=1 Tax=Castilleja foliolosa TaxID=1961234 RepID=A0ABD3D7R5_9LAMI
MNATFINGSAHSGVIIRNSNDLIIKAHAFIHSCLDLISAECLAILDACSILAHLRIKKATFESDCKNAITQINVSSPNNNWSASPIIDKINLLRKNWTSWNFKFVPRSANGAAHSSKWVASNYFVGIVPFNIIPDSIFCDDGYPILDNF